MCLNDSLSYTLLWTFFFSSYTTFYTTDTDTNQSHQKKSNNFQLKQEKVSPTYHIWYHVNLVHTIEKQNYRYVLNKMSYQLRWLECHADNVKVTCSRPVLANFFLCGSSCVSRGSPSNIPPRLVDILEMVFILLLTCYFCYVIVETKMKTF